MITSLGLASDGLLKRGGAEALHIAVRGYLRDAAIAGVFTPSRDPLPERAALVGRDALAAMRGLDGRDDMSGRAALGGREPLRECRQMSGRETLRACRDLPARDTMKGR